MERHSREARYSCCNCLDCCLPFSLNLHSTTHNLYIHVCMFACFTCGLKHLQACLHKMVVSLVFTRPVPCSRACSLCLLRLIPMMSRISIVLLYTVWFCGNVEVSVKCPWLSRHNKTIIFIGSQQQTWHQSLERSHVASGKSLSCIQKVTFFAKSIHSLKTESYFFQFTQKGLSIHSLQDIYN